MPGKDQIIIRGYGSISPLGSYPESVATTYASGKACFQNRLFSGKLTPVGALSTEAEIILKNISQEKKAYESLDKTVLMAVHAARQAINQAGWQTETDIAVNIGSSRGATGLFENYLTEFQISGQVSAQASPVTTLGNISSWVANDLQAQGPAMSHSVTCSTALQAVANGFAWLRSGMATRYLAGGSEAPLTPFTIAQMKAIGIYSEEAAAPYPCRPQNQEQKNTFVLGEGAAVFALEKISAANLNQTNIPLAILEGIGFGFEEIKSKTGISADGLNFQKAIRQAIAMTDNPEPVDLIIMHAPGTTKGDAAELNAIKAVFGEDNLPILTSNKWLIGHTLGASAALSLEYAIYLLHNGEASTLPYPTILPLFKSKKINRILVLAAGFGGNATALILSKPVS